MRLYYIDESEGPRYYVRTALGVDAEQWNELHARVRDWRLELRDSYAVPTARTAGSPRSRGPKSSRKGCASSRTPPAPSAASRSSTSACARPT